MDATRQTQAATARPLTVVVGFDFSNADGPAFDEAARLAQREPGGQLHIVHVFKTEPTREQSCELAAHLRLYVREKAPLLGGLGGVRVGVHLRTGEAARQIAQLAAEVFADWIIVGSHRGSQIKHWIVGSTARKLLATAVCPVLVADPWPKERSDAHVIVIEPPCPDCVSARAASGGAQWWCERHAHRANAAHTYSYEFEMPFAVHDSQILPTGIDV
jgi:nucleotide-binding universal stress UspA family protein